MKLITVSFILVMVLCGCEWELPNGQKLVIPTPRATPGATATPTPAATPTPTPTAAHTRVKVLTFNIFDLPAVGPLSLSPHRAARLAAICNRLRLAAQDSRGWDVVTLQEAWIASDRAMLKGCGYPYAADRDDASRALDSGLLILSKHPLADIDRLTYAQNGDVGRIFTDGEALARKSALRARVLHPRAEFWIATTHLVSFYPGADIYAQQRGEQLRAYLAWAVGGAGAKPFILGGDLNFTTASPLWSSLAGLREAPQAAGSCTICPPNTFSQSNQGKVDYLFGSAAWDAITGATAMTETTVSNGATTSLSDHFGWETEFDLK